MQEHMVYVGLAGLQDFTRAIDDHLEQGWIIEGPCQKTVESDSQGEPRDAWVQTLVRPNPNLRLEYKLLTDTRYESLENQVQAHLEGGWGLQGGVTTQTREGLDSLLLQAMVRSQSVRIY